MAYYDTAIKFAVTDHARERIKQRLKIKSKMDLEVDIEINEFLRDIVPTYKTATHDYYKIPNTFNLYAIVLRSQKLIVTLTQMTPDKIAKLF